MLEMGGAVAASMRPLTFGGLRLNWWLNWRVHGRPQLARRRPPPIIDDFLRWSAKKRQFGAPPQTSSFPSSFVCLFAKRIYSYYAMHVLGALIQRNKQKFLCLMRPTCKQAGKLD